MAKRPELRPEPIECALCGKRIGKTIQAFTVPNVEGEICRRCEHDHWLVAFDEQRAIRFVREKIRAGVRLDRILPMLRGWMHAPTHDRMWEHAGAWNDMDVHDYRTRHWTWC